MSRTFQRRRDKAVSAGKSRKFDEGLPIANKKQILGFFLVLFSVFLILSIVSYSDYDQSKLESFNLSDIFKSESKTSAYDTSNLLGIVGVILSGFFVKNTFGYFSIIIPALLIIFGIQLLRKKYISDILQFSVYLLLLMVLFSTLFGMLRINLVAVKIPYTFSGTSGDYSASILYYMLGSVGSYILIFGMILLFGFLMVDRSLVKS
ncbi:MAG: DNA translocase FtsK 4TM domain-containing protein, partial [Ignavibacteria bacterium]